MFTLGLILAIGGFLILFFDTWEDTFLIGILIIIIGFGLMIAGDSGSKESKKENCESVGGEFVIVNEEWNGKTNIDIYGCVKK